MTLGRSTDEARRRPRDLATKPKKETGSDEAGHQKHQGPTFPCAMSEAAGRDVLGERIARVEQQIAHVNADIAEIFVLIQGPPRDESIRGRIHKLESNMAAASAAEAALIVAKQLRDERSHRAWTMKEKVVTLVLATFVAVSPWVQPFLFHHN